MSGESKSVLIAGGGPVGLLCAWHLGRQGIPVRLFDDNDGLQADPRAATTHPATPDLLAEDGLAGRPKAVRFKLDQFFDQWGVIGPEVAKQYSTPMSARPCRK